MASPVVRVGSVKNLFVRQLHFHAVGDSEQYPAHTTDHLLLLAKGKLSVWIGEEKTDFTAPQMIYSKAGVRLELVAATDGAVVYSVQALRDRTGDIIDPTMVPRSREFYELLNALVSPT